MFGSGVLKGLAVTLREFVNTYVDDIKRIPSRYSGGRDVLDQSNATEQSGLFTIQYPEERRKLQERFRYVPMLVYDAETGEDRCTACGICAKVCPPQCIWIVRDKDENGKPITRPREFYIDATICMNCGMCAEFCPFDAIKMNHEYEVAAYQRMPHLVFDLDALRVPTSYYAKLHPSDWAAEDEIRVAKEAEKAAKEAAKAKPPASAPTAVGPIETAAAEPPAPRSPEEIERLKADAAARRALKAAEGGPGQPAAEAATGAIPEGAPKRTPEEIEKLKAEAAARRAAKAAEGGPAQLSDTPSVASAASAPSERVPKRTPEEIERLKAEAAARRAAKQGKDSES